MRISDWSSDVCSSDLTGAEGVAAINQDLRIRPVLLSGGAGTRLWPLSRKHYPKQLLALLSDRSMLQETALRARGLRDQLAPMVICHHEQRFLVAEQLKSIGLPPHRIVLEPVGRNTAAALVVTALLLAEEDPQALMLAQPSDHHVDR